MKPRITNPDSHIVGNRTWYDLDCQAWIAAAEHAQSDGFIQRPNRWREATFHKNGEIWALVRDLGKLNWHLVQIESEYHLV
jgi:hypothetical protein